MKNEILTADPFFIKNLSEILAHESFFRLVEKGKSKSKSQNPFQISSEMKNEILTADSFFQIK